MSQYKSPCPGPWLPRPRTAESGLAAAPDWQDLGCRASKIKSGGRDKWQGNPLPV